METIQQLENKRSKLLYEAEQLSSNIKKRKIDFDNHDVILQEITQLEKSILDYEKQLNELNTKKSLLLQKLEMPNKEIFIKEFDYAIKKNESMYNFESGYNYEIYYHDKKIYSKYSSDCLSNKILDELENKYNIKFKIDGSTWKEGSMGPYPGSYKSFRVR